MKEDLNIRIPTSITHIVRTFISLDDQQKFKISKNIGIYDAALVSMYPHERDKEIFSRAKKNKVLYDIWEELNKIAPFNTTNPFTKH